jgi:hypothetical protein
MCIKTSLSCWKKIINVVSQHFLSRVSDIGIRGNCITCKWLELTAILGQKILCTLVYSSRKFQFFPISFYNIYPRFNRCLFSIPFSFLFYLSDLKASSTELCFLLPKLTFSRSVAQSFRNVTMLPGLSTLGNLARKPTIMHNSINFKPCYISWPEWNLSVYVIIVSGEFWIFFKPAW